MRFTKTLAAIGTAGIAATLLLGGTTAANAATDAETPASDRVQGPFLAWSAKAHPDLWVAYDVPELGSAPLATLGYDGVPVGGSAYTFPKPGGDAGPISPVGKPDQCLQRSYSEDLVRLRTCDDSALQQWRINANGEIGNGNVYITNMVANGIHYLGLHSLHAEWTDRLILSGLTPIVDAAELTATVTSVDADTKSAVLSGTGEPGTELTITGPAGEQTVTVEDDGTWTATVTGLAEGDNDIKVSQTVGTDTQTVDLVATLLPSPIVAPVIAAGAGVLALGALGTTLLVRRRHNA